MRRFKKDVVCVVLLALLVGISPVSIASCEVYAAESMEPSVTEEPITKSLVGTVRKKEHFNFTDAQEIQVNMPVSDSLEKGYDYEQNYYKFTVPAAGHMALHFSYPQQNDSKIYWNIYFYNSEYKEICHYVSVYGNHSEAVSPDIGIASGTYYVKVISSDDYYALSTDTYTLRMDYEASDCWEKECNNDYLSANTISTGVDYHGSLTYGYDYASDYYKFVTKEDGVVNLKFSNPLQGDTKEYWQIQLYNEYYEILCTQSVSGNKSKTSLPAIGIAAGTYYVVVSSIDDYYAVSADTYTINADFSPSAFWEKEFNDDFTKANPMDLDTEYYGVTVQGYSYEKDYFSFVIDEEKQYDVSIETPNLGDDDYYWQMYLYDNSYEILDSSEVYGNQTKHVIDRVLSPGTYYICVTGTGSYASSTEPYKIKVSEAENMPLITPSPTPSDSSDDLPDSSDDPDLLPPEPTASPTPISTSRPAFNVPSKYVVSKNTSEYVYIESEDFRIVSAKSSNKKVVQPKITRGEYYTTINLNPKAPGKATVTLKDSYNRFKKIKVTVKKSFFVQKLYPYVTLYYGSKKMEVSTVKKARVTVRIGNKTYKKKANKSGKVKIKLNKLYKLGKKCTVTVKKGKYKYRKKCKVESRAYGSLVGKIWNCKPTATYSLYNITKGDVVRITAGTQSKRWKAKKSYKSTYHTFTMKNNLGYAPYLKITIKNKYGQTLYNNTQYISWR